MRIEILNWRKFNNPRKDVKSTSWFRFQNDYFTDPDFCDLPHEQKMVFPYLCSVASSKMEGVIEVSEVMTCSILSIGSKDFQDAINHLQHRGIIKIATCRIRHARVTDPARNGRNGRNGTERTERNGRNELKNTPHPLEDPLPEPTQALAQDWLTYASQEMPWLAKKWTVEAFGAAILKVQRTTDLNDEGVARVLAFVRTDDFWRDKACSPSGLLSKGRNGLRKIDNILAGMKSAHRGSVAGKAEAAMEWARNETIQPGGTLF